MTMDDVKKMLLDKLQKLDERETWYIDNHAFGLGELCLYGRRVVVDVLDNIKEYCKTLDDVDELLDDMQSDAANKFRYYQRLGFEHFAELKLYKSIVLNEIVADIARNQ